MMSIQERVTWKRGDSPTGFCRQLFTQKENDEDTLDFAATLLQIQTLPVTVKSPFLSKIHCITVFISYQVVVL